MYDAARGLRASLEVSTHARVAQLPILFQPLPPCPMSMTVPPSPEPTPIPQPAPLVSLVLQSKKALHHGGELCQRANAVAHDTAQCAVDVLALDAKIRFVVSGVLAQLDAARVVAKTVEEKRKSVSEKVIQWDTQRTRRCDALDERLERLGRRRVPTGFWKPPQDEVEEEGAGIFGEEGSNQQPAWKTLRDFIDEHAIEDVVELMDNERTTLEYVLLQTEAFPETLNSTISAIGGSVHGMVTEGQADVPVLIHAQDNEVHIMAQQLGSLTSHYENMEAFEADIEEPSEEDREGTCVSIPHYDMSAYTNSMLQLLNAIQQNFRLSLANSNTPCQKLRRLERSCVTPVPRASLIYNCSPRQWPTLTSSRISCSKLSIDKITSRCENPTLSLGSIYPLLLS